MMPSHLLSSRELPPPFPVNARSAGLSRNRAWESMNYIPFILEIWNWIWIQNFLFSPNWRYKILARSQPSSFVSIRSVRFIVRDAAICFIRPHLPISLLWPYTILRPWGPGPLPCVSNIEDSPAFLDTCFPLPFPRTPARGSPCLSEEGVSRNKKGKAGIWLDP